MKKHTKIIILLLILSLLVSPLGSIQAKEDTDLIGHYVQEPKGESIYQSAIITNESIKIFTHIYGVEFLYWSGTFESPASNEDSYSWSSQNDVEKTSASLFTSGTPTIEFTIKNGVLSYGVTVNGETQYRTFIKVEEEATDPNGATQDRELTKIEEEASDLDEEASDQEEGVFLDEVGYSVRTSRDEFKIMYGYVLKNTFSDQDVSRSEIEVVARDAENKILGTDSTSIHKIGAGETRIGGDYFYVAYEPEVVQIYLKPIKDRSISKAKDLRSQALEIKNLNEITKGSYERITGEIYNMSDQDYDRVRIHFLFRLDGEIVGGGYTFVDDVLADSSVVFDYTNYSGPDNYDSFEVIAFPR